MAQGISTNLNVGGQASCLQQAGIGFVFRYYSLTTQQAQKRLTKAEADLLSAAGLQIGVVYEDKPDVVEYFSNARGQQDGRNAFRYASQLPQPTGSAIYFAVDYDASAGRRCWRDYRLFQWRGARAEPKRRPRRRPVLRHWCLRFRFGMRLDQVQCAGGKPGVAGRIYPLDRKLVLQRLGCEAVGRQWGIVFPDVPRQL